MNSSDIIVSVRCIVFNHEPYLRQCLDGIVMQKTDFRFEAFVHDDASTDGSADIIREYTERYPDIIKPYIEEENLYTKKDGSFRRITYSPNNLRGKYIAQCEGDDYWTDPYKLQKQVDYMQSHPECMMCFGNATEHWEDGSKPDNSFSSLECRDYSAEENCWKWIIPTASVLFRRSVLDTPLYHRFITNNKFIVGDLPLVLTCASYGSLHAFSDYFAVYRRQRTGFTLNYDSLRHLKMGLMWEVIPSLFGQNYGEVSAFKAIHHFRKGMIDARKEKNRSRYFHLAIRIIMMYLIHPVNSGKRLKKIIQQRRVANL